MELDCALFENLEFDYIDKDNGAYPIICRVKTEWGSYNVHIFTEYGCYSTEKYSKCVIFPKGKTTWEGFQRPFKDGDVVISVYNDIHLLRTKDSSYCAFRERWNNKFDPSITTSVKVVRLATEEEKQKLFDVIKENGYKWNPKTKTLEKLIIPKFKVGDRVRNKNYKDYIYDIHDIVDKGYRAKEINADYPIIILFGSQEDNYELVPNKFDITTLKPFESKVLVRDTSSEKWYPAIWGLETVNDDYPYVIVGGGQYNCCIPYENNQHLLGTTNDCDDYYKTWE